MYLKVEWKGEGPEMPPMKTENIFKKEKIYKNRKEYTLDE
jgi:hypothetical protein